MINEIKAKTILETYNGTNDYILWIKRATNNPTYKISKTEAKYVIDNHTTNPTKVNKYVPIHPFTGSKLKTSLNLKEEPTHIYINKILSRTGPNNDDLTIWGAFEEVPTHYRLILMNKRGFLPALKSLPELNLDKYERKPKPHQITGIEALLQNKNFLLADVMGLGKTTTAILAALEGGFKKILVVCPASLKFNWKIEIEFFEKDTVSIIDGKKFVSNKWTIVNYDILDNFHHLPKNKNEKVPQSKFDFEKFDLIIADECHYVKSPTSIRTKMFNDIAKKIPTRWLLTGTPLTSRPSDFYNILDILESPLTVNWQFFMERYCKAFKVKYNSKEEVKDEKTGELKISTSEKSFWKTTGASNLDELNKFTSNLFLRRTKKELNLPLKTKKTLHLPSDTSPKYIQYLEEYQDWANEIKERGDVVPVTAHLSKLTKTRQILAIDKVPKTIELVKDYISEGHKVVVFSCFTESIRSINAHFKKESVLVDGQVTLAKRHQAVESFQNNEKIKVFCGNIKAAGVGLTLTKGTIVIFNDLDWVPANHAQAEDRCHRLGQFNEVYIIYMLVEDTIDIGMYTALNDKVEVICKVIGDDFVPDQEDVSVGLSVLKNLKAL